MLKELLKNRELLSSLRTFVKKCRKEVLDVIIFGSVSRGKRKPADIDILLLFKEKEDRELEYILRKDLEKTTGLKIQITTRTYDNLFSAGFLPREFILSEGYSIKLKVSLSKAFGYKSYILFNYKLRKFSPTKRTRFHYALYGRLRSKGIMHELGGVKISTAVLIPTENSERFSDFMNLWEVDFKKTPILIPERVVSYGEI